MNACFVTGTDTGIGKTRVAAALLYKLAQQGKRVVGMKPVASGAVWHTGVQEWEDVSQLAAASTVSAPLKWCNPYRFDAPISPHLAAQQANVQIELSTIRAAYEQLQAMADWVVVEGAGGWYAPLNAGQSMADLARALNIPVVLVVGIRLGCINHAVLTAQAIIRDGASFAGWVANIVDKDMLLAEENIDSIRTRLSAPLLGVLPWDPQAGLGDVAARLRDF